MSQNLVLIPLPCFPIRTYRILQGDQVDGWSAVTCKPNLPRIHVVDLRKNSSAPKASKCLCMKYRRWGNELERLYSRDDFGSNNKVPLKQGRPVNRTSGAHEELELLLAAAVAI